MRKEMFTKRIVPELATLGQEFLVREMLFMDENNPALASSCVQFLASQPEQDLPGFDPEQYIAGCVFAHRCLRLVFEDQNAEYEAVTPKKIREYLIALKELNVQFSNETSNGAEIMRQAGEHIVKSSGQEIYEFVFPSKKQRRADMAWGAADVLGPYSLSGKTFERIEDRIRKGN